MSKFSIEHINVLSINAYYDKKTTTQINETSSLLKYTSQHFHCHVKLTLNECIANEYWSIGLIQACDYMYLENRYGNYGSTLWEFHPLRSGRHKMVNDSDGNQYPFYSLINSKYVIERGNVTNNLIKLTYEDHFYPTIAWELPYYNGIKLTNVIRKQNFWVWLVAIKHIKQQKFNAQYDEVYILNTISWYYQLDMIIDSYQPIGKRLQSIYDKQYNEPIILDDNRTLPLSALNPPHCNAAQSLIWYPTNRNDQSKLLIPPKQIIVPWNIWLNEMKLNQNITLNKPNYCQLVKNWLNDKEIGITTNSTIQLNHHWKTSTINLTTRINRKLIRNWSNS
ncbi:hypothetical protein MN116_002558 [Schistosoma mekongi]|uniref:Protein FAM78A n=1 Tax=Schistosoma mekongi TaxID=38744 RepID=A0AAE2D9U6_SCHME|nr:hypothetical protein MN116_002558 [Schistosoma mekongi]